MDQAPFLPSAAESKEAETKQRYCFKEQPRKTPLAFQPISGSGGFAFLKYLDMAVLKAAQMTVLHDPLSSPF